MNERNEPHQLTHFTENFEISETVIVSIHLLAVLTLILIFFNEKRVACSYIYYFYNVMHYSYIYETIGVWIISRLGTFDILIFQGIK